MAVGGADRLQAALYANSPAPDPAHGVGQEAAEASVEIGILQQCPAEGLDVGPLRPGVTLFDFGDKQRRQTIRKEHGDGDAVMGPVVGHIDDVFRQAQDQRGDAVSAHGIL